MDSSKEKTFVLQKFKIAYIIAFQFMMTSFVLTQLPAFIPRDAGENQIVDYLFLAGLFAIGGGFLVKRFFPQPQMTHDFEKNVEALLLKTFPPLLVSFTFFEAAAVMGFVTYLLGGGTNNLYFLSCLAILSMILTLPRPDTIIERAKQFR